MATITTGNFSKALWPGVNAWYGKSYAEFKPQWPDLFTKHTSSKNYEEDMYQSSLGLASVKPEGTPTTYDSSRQGWVTRYTHVVYSLGFMITEEAVSDNLYAEAGERDAKDLAFSMRQTKENVATNVYNRAFTSGYTGGDGSILCVTSHSNLTGGTWQNTLTTAADLSEASLEQAYLDIQDWTNDRGLKIHLQPQTLILPSELRFEAERILMSPYRVGSTDNDINALKSMGLFSKVVINNYLTDADAWFIRTNSPHGMKCFQRWGLKFATDNDFDTTNAKFKATERYSFGWSDPRGLYGSPGA